MPHEVTNVEHLGGHRLLLTFEGREHREIDVTTLTPFDGVLAPLADEAYFSQVRVNPEIGSIVWPNGVDLCPDVLYERSHAVGREPLTSIRT